MKHCSNAHYRECVGERGASNVTHAQAVLRALCIRRACQRAVHCTNKKYCTCAVGAACARKAGDCGSIIVQHVFGIRRVRCKGLEGAATPLRRDSLTLNTAPYTSCAKRRMFIHARTMMIRRLLTDCSKALEGAEQLCSDVELLCGALMCLLWP